MRVQGTTVAIAVVVAAVGAGFLWGQSWSRADIPAVPPHVVVGGLTTVEQATIATFNGARDSVVAIATSTDVLDPFTRRRTEQPVGSGSGFIWDDDGHVVTNNHVIEGASEATVQLADGRTFQAALVGRDAMHDLAVLRISGRSLPAALPLGESSNLQVGQQVLAIGNPFGLDWTLTTGIVSALDRDLPGEDGPRMGGMIQTDAAINPGNSGGPLLDSRGRLIGVNTSIYSPSGASAGIGFAVPVGTVARIVPELIENGSYSLPSLGVAWDARINAAVNRQGLNGVMIVDVAPRSDAAEAGLEPARMSRDGRIAPGDVIVGLGDAAVATVDDLLAALDSYRPGDEVTLSLERDGRGWSVDLTLLTGD
ncbi:MAG: trypsin-like peptidase domain-containing protein [Rhodobacterales bacterium]|nr:trypsin-like peptidase domain-containing protein [Rhodobacterales bacterium]